MDLSFWQTDFVKYYSPNENAILSFRFLAQSINSLSGEDVRISKRIYLPNKRLRGFEFGKIGPIDGEDYIGGNYATAINFATTLDLCKEPGPKTLPNLNTVVLTPNVFE